MAPEALAAGSTIFSSIAAAMGLNGLEYDDVLETLGIDPVGEGTDAESIMKDAYAVDEKTGKSKMDGAAEKVGDVDKMTLNERAAYYEALKHPDKMTETTVKDLMMNGTRIVMADGTDGGHKAKTYLVKLPEDTKVLQFTYTYEGADGKIYQETGYIFNHDCANPAVDANADTVVPQEAPEVVQAPKPAVTYQVDPYYQDMCECDPKKLLVATITLPEGIVPGTPEYNEFVNKSLTDINAIQKSVGGDYHSWTGVRVVDASGRVVEAGCLKEGATGLSTWVVEDYKGKQSAIEPTRVDEVLLGVNEKDGDGYVARTLDANVQDVNGEKKLVVNVPDKKLWVSDQLAIFGDELVDHESNQAAARELVNKVLGMPIPAGFFDWNFDTQVKYLKGLGLPQGAAHDMAIYLNEISGEPKSGKDHRHLEITVEPKAGDTFGSFVKRGFESQYEVVKTRVG